MARKCKFLLLIWHLCPDSNLFAEKISRSTYLKYEFEFEIQQVRTCSKICNLQAHHKDYVTTTTRVFDVLDLKLRGKKRFESILKTSTPQDTSIIRAKVIQHNNQLVNSQWFWALYCRYRVTCLPQKWYPIHFAKHFFQYWNKLSIQQYRPCLIC